MEKKRKTEEITKYLFLERALQMKEYFRNQRSLFTSLSSKILNKKEVPKAKAFRTSLT